MTRNGLQEGEPNVHPRVFFLRPKVILFVLYVFGTSEDLTIDMWTREMTIGCGLELLWGFENKLVDLRDDPWIWLLVVVMTWSSTCWFESSLLNLVSNRLVNFGDDSWDSILSRFVDFASRVWLEVWPECFVCALGLRACSGLVLPFFFSRTFVFDLWKRWHNSYYFCMPLIYIYTPIISLDYRKSTKGMASILRCHFALN